MKEKTKQDKSFRITIRLSHEISSSWKVWNYFQAWIPGRSIKELFPFLWLCSFCMINLAPLPARKLYELFIMDCIIKKSSIKSRLLNSRIYFFFHLVSSKEYWIYTDSSGFVSFCKYADYYAEILLYIGTITILMKLVLTLTPISCIDHLITLSCWSFTRLR